MTASSGEMRPASARSTPLPPETVDDLPKSKRFAPSPTTEASVSTAIGGDTTRASPTAGWSAVSSLGSGVGSPPRRGSVAATPVPQERGRISQMFSIFKTSRSVTRPIGSQSSVTAQDATSKLENAWRRQTEDITVLRNRMSHLEQELEIRQKQLEGLKDTSRHAQQLLERNSELELLLAHVQDEHDTKLRQQSKVSDDYRASVMRLERELMQLRHQTDGMGPLREQASQTRELRRQLQDKEGEVEQVRNSLILARSETAELKSQLKSQRDLNEQLQADRFTKLTSLAQAGVTEELQMLIRCNNNLEDQLATIRADHQAELDELNSKWRQANLAKNAAVEATEKVKSQFTLKEQELENEQERSQRLYEETVSLRNRIGDSDDIQMELSQLRANLEASERNREVERSHAQESISRLQLQLRTFENIHEHASKTIARNAKLEYALAEQHKKIENLNNFSESSMLRELREQLKDRTVAATRAEEQARVLQGQTVELERQLAVAKARYVALETQSSALGPRENCSPGRWQEELQAAVDTARANQDKGLDTVRRQYDVLIAGIRKAHKGELDSLRLDYEQQLRVVATDKSREAMERLAQKEEEWAAAIRRAEDAVERQRHAQEEEFQRFKTGVEANTRIFIEEQTARVRTELAAKEQAILDLQVEHDRKLADAKRNLDSQLDRVRQEYDRGLKDKDTCIASLTAELAANKAATDARVGEAEARGRREAEVAARRKLDDAVADTERQFATQRSAWEQSLADLRSSLIDKEAEVRRLLAATEKCVGEQTDDGSDLANLQAQVHRLVTSLTEDLNRQLADSRDEAARLRAQRNSIQDQVDKMSLELKRLKGAIEERNKAMDTLHRQFSAAEDAHQKELERLRKGQQPCEHAAANSTQSEELQIVLERNRELEGIVASLSEKWHDALREGMTLESSARQQTAELNATIRSLEGDISLLKSQLAAAGRKSGTSTQDLNKKLLDLSTQLQGAKVERDRLVDELEVERRRVASLRGCQQLATSAGGEKELRRQLMQKLQDLDMLSKQCKDMALTQPSATDLEAAQALAEQRRMAGEIEFLRGQINERKARIWSLEAQLDKSRQEASSQELNLRLAELESERASLRSDCSSLEDSLRQQREKLAAEISRRDEQLKSLTMTNEQLTNAIRRNGELEDKITELLEQIKGKLGTESPPRPLNDTALSTFISAFETEYRTKSVQHEMDLRNLTAAIEERDLEVSRLQRELRNLREDLQRNHAEHAESLKIAYETEKNRLRRENEALEATRVKLQEDLEAMSELLKDTKIEEQQRLDEIVRKYSEKVTESELMMADLATIKEQELHQMETKLQATQAAQERLEAEIHRVTSELSDKENDIFTLSSAIREAMLNCDLASLNGSANSLPPPYTGENWARLLQEIESMFVQLARSQKDAKNLATQLQALLREEQRSLDEIRSSQASASTIRRQMTQLVDDSKIGQLPRPPIGSQSHLHLKGGRLSALNDGLSALYSEWENFKMANSALRDKLSSGLRVLINGNPKPTGVVTQRTATIRSFDQEHSLVMTTAASKTVATSRTVTPTISESSASARASNEGGVAKRLRIEAESDSSNKRAKFD